MPRAPKLLPPPADDERARARAAAAALRAAIADLSTMGTRSTAHIDFGRPRRGEWWETWSNVPGFTRVDGRRYVHTCLPGWEYTRAEIRAEMIPDLEALAERGERPTAATGREATPEPAPDPDPISTRGFV